MSAPAHDPSRPSRPSRPSSPSRVRYGFVGTGAITAAMVEGLSTDGPSAPEVFLSPRSAALADSLAARFATVTVCADNQGVLDASDVVVVAVREEQVLEALGPLVFSPRHVVVSVVAGRSLSLVASLVTPAGQVARAIPLPPVSRREGVTAVFPDQPEAVALGDALGRALVATSEEQLDVYSSAAAVMATHLDFLGAVTAWLAAQGVATADASSYVGALFRGLSSAYAGDGDSDRSPGVDFAALTRAHSTPGGLNEQLLAHVRAGTPPGLLESGLDDVLERASSG